MVSSWSIQNFQWHALEQFVRLTNEINGLTGTVKAHTPFSMKEWLKQPFCHPKRDIFVAQGEDGLIGYTIITPEIPIGRTVLSGGVLEPFRRRELGRHLLHTAIGHSKALGASRIDVDVPGDDQAAHHFVESEGFSQVRVYWRMHHEKKLPRLKVPRGFTVRPFIPNQDEEILTQVQNAAFSETWGFCPNTVEEVAYKTRLSRCRPEGILLLVQGRRVAGYNWTCIFSNERSSIGVVWMTGVHPDFQGRGLGRPILLAGMKYLYGQGVDAIELMVDAVNPPARRLYLSAEFEKVSETHWYQRSLAS